MICQCKIFIIALNYIHLIVNDVVYSNCTTGDVRLTDGPTEYEGRVEICMNGVWGSVCDYGWDTSEAITVCKQLGYAGENCVFNMISYYRFRWDLLCKFLLWSWYFSTTYLLY